MPARPGTPSLANSAAHHRFRPSFPRAPIALTQLNQPRPRTLYIDGGRVLRHTLNQLVVAERETILSV